MAVYLTNRQKVLPIDRGRLRRRLTKIMKALGLDEASLSVLITDDEEIRRINRDYRGKDKATNVLSFSMEEGGDGAPAALGAPRLLGDVVISAETIIREAGPLGYSVPEMFYFYLIHGFLHLLGYDHELGKTEAKRQEEETERLWNLIDHSVL